MIQKKVQTFNNGIVSIYNVKNVADPGKKIVEKIELKNKLRYDNRTVGVMRFYTAKQNNIKVAHLIRCPLVPGVSTNDVAVFHGGNQYEIKQIQYSKDIEIPCMDLTLERVGNDYGYA